MSRQKPWLVASTIALLLGGAGDAFAQLNPEIIRQRASGLKLRPELLEFAVPLSPNPWTSLGSEAAEADWDYWNARAYERSMTKAASRPTPSVRVNGRRQRDIRVRNFGTRRGQRSSVQITGEFSLPAPLPFKQAPEDEGSIPLASETGLTAGSALVVNGTIGDGSFGLAGTGSGDFDFYAIRDVRRGERIMVDIDTAAPFDPLDPAVAVYNSLGEIVAFNDDNGGTFDSFVFVAAPEDGDYFVSIGTFGNPILADPFDSSSGSGVEMTFFPRGTKAPIRSPSGSTTSVSASFASTLDAVTWSELH